MNINKDTRIYGSFSNNPGNNGCIFFNEMFEKHNINAIYKSFYSINTKDLITSVKHLNFSGFALSMPLKINIIKYLDKIDESASEIGAVNTVVNNNSILTGYNTDWLGVKNYLSDLLNESTILTILGNGGFSKAIQYYCRTSNIPYKVITRLEWEQVTELSGYVFNATPININISKHAHLIDGRPFTEEGQKIAKLQAIEQFYLYTNIKI